ncbi:MAG: PIN domain-containing protein [Acidobacteriota bacterium]
MVGDAVVLGELRAGLRALPAGRRRARLERWFASVAETVECLLWDARVGMRWAELIITLKRKGQPMSLLDSVIAATGLHHGLSVVTRNVRDFRRTGVDVHDPFA